MPEGHILHRLAETIASNFAGDRVTSLSPQGRFEGATIIDGSVLANADTWGKHLFVAFDSTPDQVHIHLGIYGTLRFAQGVPSVVGQVRWRLSNGETTADLRGPSACSLLNPTEVATILNRLGPDPLRTDANPDRFIDRVRRSRAPIATLLMDQSVIAGTGNIYRAEVLFRLGIAPMSRGQDLTVEQVRLIWMDMVDLMRVGKEHGRIDTVRPEHEPAAMGRPPRVDDHGGEVYVYRRQGMPCWVCGSTVLTSRIGGRNLFWCPSCQA